MKPAILLFCGSLLFGQSTSPAPESKAQPPAGSAGSVIQQAAQAAAARREPAMQAAAVDRQSGAVDILSDTQGVDFGPYSKNVVQSVRENWYHLIPESAERKKGKLVIEFAITKHGQINNMSLVASSGDVALDRPAWGSITASNPFPALPEEFTGPYIKLRFRFFYNPDKTSGSVSSPTGITVTILTAGDLQVPVGGSEVVSATVTGTKEQAVEWSVKGSGCSGSACGKMVGALYVAPTTLPSPPEVILTAASKADPNAKAAVTVHILRTAAQTSSKP
jgi:TonB family protein